MITILLWHLGATLLLTAAFVGVVLAQWSVGTCPSRLRSRPVQAQPTGRPARPARPLVSGGAQRG
ncbi:hypothetical protein BH24ACT10_BH24ACT10_17760 [soil metagenome]